MIRRLTIWLAGTMLTMVLVLTGCQPPATPQTARHVYGEPVQYETLFFMLTERGKVYYATDEELKLALQRHQSQPVHQPPGTPR